MRRKNADRQKMLMKLRKLCDRKDAFQWPQRRIWFSDRVKDELQWIEDQKILGTWGGKGQDIRYDPHVFGDRCRKARMEKRYSEKEVANRLSCKTHSYISGVEDGSVKVDIVMLEAFSLLYHKMPKYLLGLEEKSPESAVFVANRCVDKCEFLILNHLATLETFDFSAEWSWDDRLAYIEAVTKLGGLPDSIVHDLLKISEIIPILQKIYKTPIPEKHKLSERLLPFYNQPTFCCKDEQKRELANKVWHDLQRTFDDLCDHNPEWLFFIAQIIVEQPECIFLLLYIIEHGEFILSGSNATGCNDSKP